MRPVTLIAIIALAVSVLAVGMSFAQPSGLDPALARHCLTANPVRLALTADQVARIEAIDRSYPDSAQRRAAILQVLTRAQLALYWNTAGVAAC
jgi:hypothetical protein